MPGFQTVPMETDFRRLRGLEHLANSLGDIVNGEALANAIPQDTSRIAPHAFRDAAHFQELQSLS